MATIHETAKHYGRFDRRDNRARESMVKSEPKFRAAHERLITRIGHAV